MRFAGLDSAWVVAGGAALALALLALHLLRVRLRRVAVETLLFFRAVQTTRRPVVMPGRPARFGAYLLALAALLAGWLAFADPIHDRFGASRVIIHRGAEESARALAAERGLGPRGAVLAAA